MLKILVWIDDIGKITAMSMTGRMRDGPSRELPKGPLGPRAIAPALGPLHRDHSQHIIDTCCE